MGGNNINLTFRINSNLIDFNLDLDVTGSQVFLWTRGCRDDFMVSWRHDSVGEIIMYMFQFTFNVAE